MPAKTPVKPPAKKSQKSPAKKATAKKGAAKKPAAAKAAARKIPPRADRGDGEAAVQARIKALKEPSKSILAKLHAIVAKTAPTLEPTVRWGFAVYSRGGKMLLVASGYTKYARLGFTKDAGVTMPGEGYIEYTDASQVDEREVVALVKQLG